MWRVFLSLLSACHLVPTAALAEDWQKGVLMTYAYHGEKTLGVPGQVVQFRETPPGVQVRTEEGTSIEGLGPWVVPSDEKFTPARVFLYLSEGIDEPPHCNRNPTRTLERLLLANNIAAEFPDHQLHDDLLALASEKENILQRLARLHRIVYECVTFATEPKMKAGLSQRTAEWHLKKATRIYSQLAHSKNSTIRNTAITALYNLENNRSAYTGAPSDW